MKKNLEQSPKIKTFQNILQSSTHAIPECSTKFYNILLDNSSTFEKVQDYSFLLLDSSIYIIEQYTNLKYTKHQEMNSFV